mgnify:FL=1
MSKLATVMQGLVELPNGKTIQVDSRRWFDWVESSECRSFRFSDGESPYTCRKERVKGVEGYWYGYRKVEGKLHKRYIGKSADLTVARLVQIGELLGFPSVPKLPKSVCNPVDSNQGLQATELHNELGNLQAINSELHNEVTQLKAELARLRSQLSSRVAQDSEGLEPPEAATLLNQLKVRRKKSKADLADVEAILGMIEESTIQAED